MFKAIGRAISIEVPWSLSKGDVASVEETKRGFIAMNEALKKEAKTKLTEKLV